jgi:hypothetical protein
MLHLAKLAVGIRDLAHLQAVQRTRAEQSPPLRHFTRNHPRRAAEVIDGGSIFWVIGGIMLVRQRILDIRPDQAQDGSKRTALVLDRALIAVRPRATKAFQGWRYLAADAAPADLGRGRTANGVDALPEALRRDLASLGLL